MLQSSSRSRESSSQRGAVLAEFAVILPLLMLLVFGIIELSIAFNRHQAVHAAAREGARAASIPNGPSPCGRVSDALAGINITENCSVSAVCTSGGGPDSVDVSVTAPHTISVLFIADINVTLSGEASFRCE